MTSFTTFPPNSDTLRRVVFDSASGFWQMFEAEWGEEWVLVGTNRSVQFATEWADAEPA